MMRLLYSFRLILAGSILFMFPSLNILAQADSLISVTAKDQVTSDSSRHSLFTGFGYGNTMIYLGSTLSQDYPYGYGSLTYGYNQEIYASVTAVHIDKSSPFAAFWVGSLSYNHVFNSWFDISAGLYRYQMTQALKDTLFASFNYIDLTLGIDWRILYTKISAGELFTSQNGTYLQIRNSRYFQTPAFFNDKIWISFDPYVNLIFGPMLTLETSSDTIVTTYHPFNKKGNGYGVKSNPVKYSVLLNSDYQMKFGFLEVDLGLPISINSNRLTIEAETGYVFPAHKELYYPGLKGLVFTVSCFVRII